MFLKTSSSCGRHEVLGEEDGHRDARRRPQCPRPGPSCRGCPRISGRMPNLPRLGSQVLEVQEAQRRILPMAGPALCPICHTMQDQQQDRQPGEAEGQAAEAAVETISRASAAGEIVALLPGASARSCSHLRRPSASDRARLAPAAASASSFQPELPCLADGFTQLILGTGSRWVRLRWNRHGSRLDVVHGLGDPVDDVLPAAGCSRVPR